MKMTPKLSVLALLVALLLGGAASFAQNAPREYKLIYHRGGVVEDAFPDNSAGALQAAIARKAWMLEVDIRETKDGILVMRHDADLQAYYHEPRKVQDLSWDDIRGLKSDLASQRLWRFEDLVKAARAAGLWLMLDSKDPHSPEFVRKVEAVLRDNAMVERCYIIGTGDALAHFYGKALVGLKYGALKSKLEADPTAKDKCFLFGQGDMTEAMVTWAQSKGIKVVPSINVYHYYDAATMSGKPRAELEKIIFAAARRDIEKFQRLGVIEFQIDSEFDRWFK